MQQWLAACARTSLLQSAAQRRRRRKAPDSAKRTPSAYNIFVKEFYTNAKDALPDGQKPERGEWMKDAGNKWNTMSAEQRKPYDERAAAMKGEA